MRRLQRPDRATRTTQGRVDGEEFNSLTRGVGAVLALAGAVVHIVRAALDGNPWKVVSVSIYGLTLVLLYSASVLCHSPLQGRAKDLLRRLDHQSICLLIAASRTPFCLVSLRGPWGWSLLGPVWGRAVLGGEFTGPRDPARRHPHLGLVAASHRHCATAARRCSPAQPSDEEPA